VETRWSWLRIGTGGGHLWVRWGSFGFQKCGEFLDWLQNQLASQEGLCSMESLSKCVFEICPGNFKWSVCLPVMAISHQKIKKEYPNFGSTLRCGIPLVWPYH
jgi:hypothetical protein